jgi:hypothetical protein
MMSRMKTPWMRLGGVAVLAGLTWLSVACSGADEPSADTTTDAGARDSHANDEHNEGSVSPLDDGSPPASDGSSAEAQGGQGPDAGPDAEQADDSSDAGGVPDVLDEVPSNVPDAADVPDAQPDSSVPLPEAGGGKPDVVPKCGNISCDCTFHGKKLWGKVQFVDVFPDVKVRIVPVFEDLRVQKVAYFPDSCGKWQEDDFPDLKVQIVDVFEDFTIRYVDFDPGVAP